MTEAPETLLFCENHPQRETSLRCNRCEKPICPDCAVLTPTGYRCRECVRSFQKAFDTAQWFDYPVSFVVAGGLSFVGSLLAIPLGFFTLLLAPVIGILIASLVRALVRRRRSKRLFLTTAVAVVLGSAPNLISFLLFALSDVSRGGYGSLFALLWQGAYTVIVTSTVYYRLSGIQLRG